MVTIDLLGRTYKYGKNGIPHTYETIINLQNLLPYKGGRHTRRNYLKNKKTRRSRRS